MAFAALLTTGCGAFPGACLPYLSDGQIKVAATPAFMAFQEPSPEMRLFATTGFRRDLTKSSASFVQTAMPPLRAQARTRRVVGNG